MIGGVRQTAHLHDTPPCRSIGLMLAAGATSRLLGAPASAFAGSHIGTLSLAERGMPWADVALGAGFFDQPHPCREFQRIVGVTPSQWRGAATSASHVPIADPYKPQCSGTR